MAENGNTAEHELLKAIEGKTPVVANTSTTPAAAKETITSFAAGVGKVFSSEKLKEKLDLSSFNKILMGIIVVLILWQGLAIAWGVIRLGNIPKFDTETIKEVTEKAEVIAFPLKKYEQYSNVLLSRNIFKTAEKTQQQEAIPVSSLQNMIGKLKLVGISWSGAKEKRWAMIEDTKTAITYYVQEGDSMLEFKVDKVLEDKVTLNYNGNEVSLR